MYRISTRSGRVYEVDTEKNFWRRLPRNGESLWGAGWERLWVIKGGTMEHDDDGAPQYVWHDRLPEVGEMLYVSSRDAWWRSTPVASIEEVPSTFGVNSDEDS